MARYQEDEEEYEQELEITCPKTNDNADNAIQSYDEQVLITGWRRIFNIPYESLWMFAVILVGCIRVNIALFEIGFKSYNDSPKSKVFSFIDDVKILSICIYVVNVVLIFGGRLFCDVSNFNTKLIPIPLWISCFDLLSLIPLELFVLLDEPMTPPKARLYYIVQVWQIFKLIPVFYILFAYDKTLHRKDASYALEHFLFTTFIVIVGMSLSRIIHCHVAKCSDMVSRSDLLQYYLASLYKITGKGYSVYPDSFFWMICYNLLNLLYACGCCIIVSLIAARLLIQFENHYSFVETTRSMKNELRILRVSKNVSTQCVDHYRALWKKMKIPNVVAVQESIVLPETMMYELSLDISWVFFKHCRIFRNMDLPFLRYVSRFVKSLCMLPGEVLYDKSILKNCMAYIVSGVIQIPSEEDGRTPIISLTSGTCLGEISLILNDKPNVNVYCKTYSSIKILHRKDFISVSKKFPQECRHIMNSLKERVSKTRISYESHKGNDESQKRRKQVTMLCLKSILHTLMADNDIAAMNYINRNIFLRSQLTIDQFPINHFNLDNLDSLAICERLQLETETVFLKNSCPCILQPTSLITDIYEIIIYLASIYAAIIIPYFGFVQSNTPTWYVVSVYVITFLWWLDLYIKLSTVVKNNNEIITTFVGIFIYRIESPEFLADAFAALPLEIFSPIFVPYVTGQIIAILHLNRVVKLWHIIVNLYQFENEYYVTWAIFRHVNYFFVFSYCTYFVSCLLYAANCFGGVCYHKIAENSIFLQMIWNMMSSSQIISATGLVNDYDLITVYHPIRIGLIWISAPFNLFVVGTLVALFTLQRQDILFYRSSCATLQNISKLPNVTKVNAQRLFNYMDTQWRFIGRLKRQLYDTVFNAIPQHMFLKLKNAIYFQTFSQVTFFKHLPNLFLYHVCPIVDGCTFPANEVVSYAGEFTDRFFVIERGICKTISHFDNNSVQLFYPFDALCVIEAFTKLPSPQTVVTVTDCRLISIDSRSFAKIYNSFYTYKDEIKEALESVNAYTYLSSLNIDTPSYQNCFGDLGNGCASFCIFGYNFKNDSFEEYDYYIPFDRAYPFSWVRFLLLRLTIIPEGKFLLLWEVMRCVCAILSCILYSIVYVSTHTNSAWYYLLWALDCMVWIDIYLRLHVCYYNKDGVLITHPLNTAKYYLTHAFLIDFIGAVPLHYLYSALGGKENLWYSTLKLNRTIQIRRYMGFINYLISVSVSFTTVKVIFSFVPVVLVFTCSCAAFLYSAVCEFDPNNIRDSDSRICRNIELIIPNSLEMYFHYIAASVLTTTGMTGFKITTPFGATAITVLTIVGFFLTLHITSVVMSCFVVTPSLISTPQYNIKVIRRFLSYYEVNRALYDEVISYYKLDWQIKQCKHLSPVLNKFNVSLSKDVYFEIYGADLQENSALGPESIQFIRNILPLTKHYTICSGSLIGAVNDVSMYLHIIYKGCASVFSDDGTRLAILTPGAIFGNLDNSKWSCQTITVRAATDVEILTLETTCFYQVLNNYPNVLTKFEELIAFNCAFLEGRCQFDVMSKIPNRSRRCYLFEKICLQTGNFFKVWNAIILTLVCVLGVWFELYQLAMKEFSVGFIVFQYVCDGLYFVHCIFRFLKKCRTSSHSSRPAALFHSKNWLFILIVIVSMLPMDLISWSFSWEIFEICYGILRFNRFLRLYFIGEFVLKRNRMLETNVIVINMGSCLMWLFFVLHLFTCILIIIGCSESSAMIPKLNCNRRQMSIYARFQLYCTYSHVIVNIFVRSNNGNFFPYSPRLITMFTLTMIIMYFVSTVFLAIIFSSLLMLHTRRNFNTIRLERIKRCIKIDGVSVALFNKIVDHLELFSSYKTKYIPPKIFDDAPVYLREAVLNSIFAHHIDNHIVFGRCHADFKRQLVGFFKIKLFFIRDYVVHKGSFDDSMYFIHKGIVEALDESDHGAERKLRSGMSFGTAQGVLQKKPHIYSYCCLTETIILILQRNTWQHLLSFFPASRAEIYSRIENYQERYSP